MNTIRDRLKSLDASPWTIPAVLLVVTVLSYGVFFWQLGFYWDDQPMSWVRYQFGPDAMRLYFSRSRPVWGELYQVTTRWLPHVPAYWQAFALFWRWLTAVLCWAVIRRLWPRQTGTALIVAAFFLLYPGFNLQWVSYLSSHFFIVLCFFLLSYFLMLLAFERPAWHLPLTLAAMVFSALNLRMLEYFYFLELLRPFVIAVALLGRLPSGQNGELWKLLKRVLVCWLPYLALWVADALYRALVFSNQAYENALLADLSSQPLVSTAELGRTVLSNLWLVSARAWALVFDLPNAETDGLRSLVFYFGVTLSVAGLIGYVLFRARAEKRDGTAGLWLLGLGLVAMLTGGFSYWLAKVVLTLGFPATRFTISFMLGVSLTLAGLLELLPRPLRSTLAVILIALAAGRQASWAESFRRDWNTERSMFWQMKWRAPGIAPQTAVLMNEGALTYAADNSLGAALNWIYDPGNRSTEIHYVLYFPTNRLGRSTLPGFEPGIPIAYDNFLIGGFRGNTSQVLAFYYQPPGCLRLLDPAIDSLNRLIPDSSLMREAAALSSDRWILPSEAGSMPSVYFPEPPHGWCYYFERAALAVQEGDWRGAASLGDQALRLEDYPNDPTERFVFIEAYAHTGNWMRSIELTEQSYRVSRPYVGPLLCRLWQRIESETESSPERTSTLAKVWSLLACGGE